MQVPLAADTLPATLPRIVTCPAALGRRADTLCAAVALGQEPALLARAAQTVTLCLSKGLGAPVGSVAAGSNASMHSVRRWRKALGGGMRQAGVLAAAALPALDDFDAALSRDHALAPNTGSVAYHVAAECWPG